MLTGLLIKYELDQECYTLYNYDSEEEAGEKMQVSDVVIATKAGFARYAVKAEIESVEDLDDGNYIPVVDGCYEPAERLKIVSC